MLQLHTEHVPGPPLGYGGFPWYALHVRAGHELASKAILAGKGFEAYVPSYRRQTRWSDRIQKAEEPLFPGYMFCRFDVSRRLPILTTPGVVSVVGFGRSPAQLELKEMQAVRQLVSSNALAEPCPYIRVGERVRVKAGPLAGMEGILVSRKKECRFIISLSLLEQSVSTEIDCELLQRF